MRNIVLVLMVISSNLYAGGTGGGTSGLSDFKSITVDQDVYRRIDARLSVSESIRLNIDDNDLMLRKDGSVIIDFEKKIIIE